MAITSVSAGSFNSDFSNPNQTGFTLNGGFRADGVTPYPAIANGYLTLVYNENSQQGSIVINDLDGGAAIDSFTVRFKLQIGPGSGNPADGLALSFAPEITDTSNFSEEGTGTGVSVCFDIYDNGDGEAPAIDVKYGNVVLATTKFAKADLVTSQFQDVEIQVTRSGFINVSHKGQMIYENLALPNYAPMAGRFAIGARTGGENAHHRVDDLNIVTTLTTSVAPAITTQPENQTVNEGAAATFTIGFDGSAPMTFQWLKNDVAIAGANSPSYRIDRTAFADNGAKLKCTVSNNAGSVTSQEATLTVNQDTTPPQLALATGSVTFNEVKVIFSEPVDLATSQALANYQLSGGVTISAATRSAVPADNIVVLTTSQQGENVELTLTVNNVKDLAGNTMTAAGTYTLRTFAWVPGIVIHEYWENVGASIGALTGDPRFPNAPSWVTLEPMFEYPPNAANEAGTGYGNRLSCWFTPAATDDFIFYLSADDAANLYLSTDANPANKKLIAQETGWSNPRNWNTIGGGSTVDEKRSDLFQDTEWPDFPLRLQVSTKYYLEALHVEGSGGDNLSATFGRDADYLTPPANGTAPALTGNLIGAYVDMNGAAVNIAQQPQSLTAVEITTATFAVVATSTSAYGPNLHGYQWQSAPSGGSTFTDIAGATQASYTTPVLALADSGKQYRVLVKVLALTEPSSVATLTVVPDTFPPVPTAGAIVSRDGTTVDIGIGFDERINDTAAGVAGNYSISQGTLSSFTYYPKSQSALLKVTGLAAGGSTTVTVRNVADLKGNAISSVEVPVSVSTTLRWGVVGAAELGIAGNYVVPLSAEDFDVYSNGIGEWGTHDEATFVYEEITGDFDKKAQVTFQENSSQWARAGIIVRDVTNFGVNNATQTGSAGPPVVPGVAGRYQKVHVNPSGITLTGPGTAGNNMWEGNRRLLTGGITSTAGGGGGPLDYPNCWVRLQRAGQTFTIYRSTDGENWTQLGATTWPTDAGDAGAVMPDKLFVGPEFSPENGNVTNIPDRGTFLAQIRNYGDTSSTSELGPLDIEISGANVTISWPQSGTLQSADTIGGSWNNVQGAASPFTVQPTAASKFYRLTQ
jgi:hypothetical protein